MIDKEKLKRRFSRNAKTYNKYANVQKKMAAHLLKWAQEESVVIKNILEIGCGTGYVTQRLVEYFPTANITAVDIAEGMIDQAKMSVTSERVEFRCGDFEAMQIQGEYDLIISNATFQWFNDFDQTLEKIVHLLSPRGILCFSTFGENTFSELHEAFNKAAANLQINEKVSPSQSFFSLHDLRDKCSQIIERGQLLGYEVEAEEAHHSEHFPSCTDFLFSIKKIGANNSDTDRKVMPPGFIENVIHIYEKEYREREGVVATYHLLFFRVKKKSYYRHS